MTKNNVLNYLMEELVYLKVLFIPYSIYTLWDIQTVGEREKDTKNSKKLQYGIKEFHPNQATKR